VTLEDCRWLPRFPRARCEWSGSECLSGKEGESTWKTPAEAFPASSETSPTHTQIQHSATSFAWHRENTIWV